jgi:hypothetical protein
LLCRSIRYRCFNRFSFIGCAFYAIRIATIKKLKSVNHHLWDREFRALSGGCWSMKQKDGDCCAELAKSSFKFGKSSSYSFFDF